MENVGLNFENGDAIFNSFHALFALDTGDLQISANLYDYDARKNSDDGMTASGKYKKPTGKHLSVSVSDNNQFADYMDDVAVSTRQEGFSFQKLKDMNQEDWTDLDYKIAIQILECYVEFILSGDKSYYETKKISKAGWTKEFGLVKGCPGDKKRSDGKGKGHGTGEGKGPIGRQGDIDRKGEGPKKDKKKSKKKSGKKSGDNMKLKDLVKSMIKDGMSKEDIKKVILDRFDTPVIKAEDIIKSDGQVFKMTDKTDKPIDDFLKAAQPTADILNWEGYESKEYVSGGRDLEGVEKSQGEAVASKFVERNLVGDK